MIYTKPGRIAAVGALLAATMAGGMARSLAKDPNLQWLTNFTTK